MGDLRIKRSGGAANASPSEEPVPEPLCDTLEVPLGPPARHSASPQQATGVSARRPARLEVQRFGPDKFVLGANLPWVSYGNDFGANAWSPQGGVSREGQRKKLTAALDDAATAGIRDVRWFMLCDGRSGIRFAPDGTPLGLDDHFFADVDAALSEARRYGIRVTFALFDFHWFMPARTSGGVQMGGHTDLMRNPQKRSLLLERVVRPILERYGNDPSILAWDILNEPEGATLGYDATQRRDALTPSEMRSFLGDGVKAVHRVTTQAATVGMRRATGLDLVRGLGLDVYQVHWYDASEARAPLATPRQAMRLDRPVILGEFPSHGSRRRVPEIVEQARHAGYGGAFAWSLLAEDDATSYDGAILGLAEWAGRHDAIVSSPLGEL